jgi:hypothetical protein
MKKLLLTAATLVALSAPAVAGNMTVEQTAIGTSVAAYGTVIHFVVRYNDSKPVQYGRINCAGYDAKHKLVNTYFAIIKPVPGGTTSGFAMPMGEAPRPDHVECEARPD